MESHLAAEHVVSVIWLQRSHLHLRDPVPRDSGGRKGLRHFDKQGLSYQDVRAKPRDSGEAGGPFLSRSRKKVARGQTWLWHLGLGPQKPGKAEVFLSEYKNV